MKAIEGWLLGYVVNALWQGAVLGCAAWLLARAMRRLGPRTEHTIWCVALLAQVVLPALIVRPVSILWGTHGGTPGLVTVVTGEGHIAGALRLPSSLLTVAASAYGLLLAVLALQLGWKLWRTFALARRAELLVLEGATAKIWQQTCDRFQVAGAETRVSNALSGPVTVGVWRRLVIFPRGFVELATETELAAATAHECAHMARHDFAKNLMYETLLLPVAWHPAMWLVRARVAESREIVCDAMAAESMAGGPAYARALLQLASRMLERPLQPTTHAIGVFDANRLEERVIRLTEKRLEMRGARRLAMAAMCMAAGIGTLYAAAEMRVSVAVPVAGQVAAQHDDAPAVRTPRVSAGVITGNLLTHVNPKYPQAAKDAKVQGAVVLKALIGKDGTIQDLQVVSGPDELTQSALDAVKQWTYKPYLLNGEPTAVQTTITVNYALGR